jgi:hypothetical protein
MTAGARYCGIRGCGLEGWEDGGFFLFVLPDALEESADGAEALFCFGDFGAWGEGAEFGVDGDLLYGFGGFLFLVAVA